MLNTLFELVFLFIKICTELRNLHRNLVRASKMTNFLCTQRDDETSASPASTKINNENKITGSAEGLRNSFPDKDQLRQGLVVEKATFVKDETCYSLSGHCASTDSQYFTSVWKNPLLKSDKLTAEYVHVNGMILVLLKIVITFSN